MAALEQIPEIFFLLYDGSSADGVGSGEFYKATTLAEVAYDHFLKCKLDPYSTGKVVMVRGDKATQPWKVSEWEGLVPKEAQDAGLKKLRKRWPRLY